LLLAGGEGGFFDRGSFTETLAGWAKPVVVGRARLGSIPMGIVITENRTAEAINPADPADAKASEVVIQQAGCVWFPNSDYKTAQAREERSDSTDLFSISEVSRSLVMSTNSI
jgi:acetyl-CoA carboxylase/biotin carboxylase 1